MAERIQKMHPEYPPERVKTESEEIAGMHFQEVKEARRNKKSFAFLDVPLPEDTQWSNIKLIFLGYNKDPKQSKIEIYVKGKLKKKTNLHEMCLENTVEGGVSDS
jgi:hypothetical protein